MLNLLRFPMALLLMPLAASVFGQAPLRSVEVANKPGDKWVARPTRTLEDLPGEVGIKTDSGLSRFGGLTTRMDKATGFFHTAKI